MARDEDNDRVLRSILDGFHDLVERMFDLRASHFLVRQYPPQALLAAFVAATSMQFFTEHLRIGLRELKQTLFILATPRAMT